ncbi:hypothetical protein [Zavarzinella formosa]|uniref:hypothetical protein n=1 Tax=Zavarzinella formosa TaxID=360055 RepID=UPI0002EF358D|nr:hypothetical protein [Zavarzinella formosa]
MNRLLQLLMLWMALALPTVALAQQPPADDAVTRGTKIDPNDPKPEAGKETPVLAYFLALVGSAGVLFIICSPGRKK